MRSLATVNGGRGDHEDRWKEEMEEFLWKKNYIKECREQTEKLALPG